VLNNITENKKSLHQ